MRKISLGILLFVALGNLGWAQAGPAKSPGVKEIQNEILKLEQSKVRALLQGGTVAANWFRRYFADNIDYTSGSGRFFTKAQTVDEFQNGDRKLVSVHHDDYRVNVYNDDTAVLTYRGNDVMLRKGKTLRGVNRTTDVYVKFPDGVWRIVVHHVTACSKALAGC